MSVNIQDLGVAVVNEKPRAKKKGHSGFLLTINTNYKPKDEVDAEQCGEKLREVLGSMLDETNLKEIISWQVEGEGWEKVDDVTGEFIVERGRHAKGGRIHSHVILHFDHRTKIRLDIPKIKEHITKGFEGSEWTISNPYVNIRIIGSDRNIQDYLRKEL
jgi:hypothetical protein